MPIGAAAWRLAFEISPIILVEGPYAGLVPGGMVPLILLTEAINFPLGMLSQGRVPSLDDAFAHFTPLAGATVVDQQIATYPFANMAVAANAVVQQPLHISMHMTAPARGVAAYWAKLAKMTLLIEMLKWHNRNGGMYHVITPSALFTNCIMKNMRDVSSGQTKQVQNIWQMDFEKPLLTVEDAMGLIGKLNGMLEKITGGEQTTTALTSNASTVGNATPPVSSTVLPGGRTSGGILGGGV